MDRHHRVANADLLTGRLGTLTVASDRVPACLWLTLEDSKDTLDRSSRS